MTGEVRLDVLLYGALKNSAVQVVVDVAEGKIVRALKLPPLPRGKLKAAKLLVVFDIGPATWEVELPPLIMAEADS